MMGQRFNWLEKNLIALALWGLVSPLHWASALAAEPARPAMVASPAPIDVALAAGGALRGEVVNGAGHPLVGTVVRVRQGQEIIATRLTGRRGEFEVTGLRGGLYLIETEQTSRHCRLWTTGAAPPAAIDRLLIVAGETLSRGQRPFREFFFNDAVLVGAVVGAAVAIPVAIQDSKSGS